MSPETLTFLVLGAIAGGFINGLSGTGMGLFSLGFYLLVLEPKTAVAITALMAVLSGLQGVWVVRHAIAEHPRRLARFILPGVVGVPAGIWVLTLLDASMLRISIASFLILYGGYFGFRTALPAIARPTPWIDSCVGFAGGVLGGAAAASGAVPSMWLSMRAWSKAQTRAVLQGFNMVMQSTTVCLLFVAGAYDRTALNALLITVPVVLLSAQVGLRVFRALSDAVFRRLLIILTLLVGLGVLLSELSS